MTMNGSTARCFAWFELRINQCSVQSATAPNYPSAWLDPLIR
jgi:hypothetical protein